MFLAVANPLNSSELIFPTLEVIHIVGFAVLVGTIAIVDFRLLNLGMRRQKAAEVASDLAPWTAIGLAMVLLSGPLMFSSDPDMYYLNRSFQVKMVLLLAAIIFQYTIHRKVAKSEGPPFRQKLVACVSMVLWVGVIFGGIFIAFI
jgi:uncharacterized protein DUF6644